MSTNQGRSHYNAAGKRAWPRRRAGADSNPLRLTSVYAPGEGPVCMDIVLVHGLGGTSRDTWTKGSYFWPGSLEEDDPLQMARVWTFGYRADFKSPFKKSAAGIFDFALDLLYYLRNNDEIHGSELPQRFQKSRRKRIPLVFVAHSMGGLVVKEAFLEGLNSEEYQAVAKSICAMLFLGTPHQGSALATTLAWCFNTSGRGVEPFIHELRHKSPELEEINKKFCTVADSLYITSFYETLETGFGPLSKIIVDRESSRLGIEQEIQIPMDTDHRNIARHEGPADPNLRKIVRQLQRYMNMFGPWKNDVWDVEMDRKNHLVRHLLGVNEPPQNDLTFFLDMAAPGTCEWIKSDHKLLAWHDKQVRHPEIMWVHGLPGCGKSVLASCVVRDIQQDRKLTCHYFFCREDDHNKTSVASLLRSIALQTASSSCFYLNYLAELALRGTNLDHKPGHAVWNQLFASELPKLEDDYIEPVYWVIDGLDMCSSGETLFTMLASSNLSRLPLRILILSRWSPELCTAASRANAISIDLDTLPARDKCLRSYAESRLGSTHPFLSQLATHAQGNFLWVDLVLDDLLHCYTAGSMATALEESRSQFEKTWRTNSTRLITRWRRDEPRVAKNILAWATYAKSPLSSRQLITALRLQGLELCEQLDVTRLCGSLIKVDRSSCISLSHRTVRQFLTEVKDHELYLEPRTAYADVLRACLRAMIETGMGRPGALTLTPFHNYAMVAWEHHIHQFARHTLNLTPPIEHGDGDLLSLVEEFLEGRSMVEWIYWVAETNQLNLMVSAANALTTFHSSLSTRSKGASILARPWADELLRILGQFGSYLLKYPMSIYNIVPPFCPSSSLLRNRVDYVHGPHVFDLKGIFCRRWGDLLARISNKQHFIDLACTKQYVALSVSSTAGDVLVFTALDISPQRTLRHGEFIQKLCFSNSGTMLATYGSQTVKVWQMNDHEATWIFKTHMAVSVLDMVFSEDDAAVLACARDGKIWKFPLSQATNRGTLIGSIVEKGVNGIQEEPPNAATFQPGANMLAASYSHLPVIIWSLTGTSVVRRWQQPSWQAEVKSISWTPAPQQVLIVRQNGSASKWNPRDQQEIELASSGIDFLKSSTSGALLIAGNRRGFIDIRKSSDFSLVDEIRGLEALKQIEICPHGHRMYGIRANTCDIWGPTCLARYSVPQEANSDGAGEKTRLEEEKRPIMDAQASNVNESPVEVLAVGSLSNIYCTAYSRGEIKIFEASGNLRFTEPAPYPFSIFHLSWSSDERYLAVLNDEENLSVKRFQTRPPRLEETTRMTIKGNVRQMFFIEDSRSLILSVDSSIKRLDWKAGVEVSSFVVNSSYRWMIHPNQSHILLGFGNRDLCALHVETLELQAYFDFSWPQMQKTESSFEEMHAFVSTETTALYVVENGSQVLVQTRDTDYPYELGLFFVAIKDVDVAYQGLAPTIRVSVPPRLILDRVSKPLGFTQLSNHKNDFVMAFIDRDGLLCTLDTDWRVREHGFLPPAWRDSDCMELAQLGRDGAIFIPKDGEVGILVNVFSTLLPGLGN